MYHLGRTSLKKKKIETPVWDSLIVIGEEGKYRLKPNRPPIDSQ